MITYTESEARALGLGPDEASPPPLMHNFTAEAGDMDKLRLPAAFMAVKTVLNAGTVRNRTIVPETILSIFDR